MPTTPIVAEPELEIMQETVEIIHEPDVVTRERPTDNGIVHYTTLADRDVEDGVVRQRILKGVPVSTEAASPAIPSPETVIRDSETITTTTLTESPPRVAEKVRKSVSFDRDEATMVRQISAEAEETPKTVEIEQQNEAVTSSTTRKGEKSKSKGFFGRFRSGSKEEKQLVHPSTTVVTDVQTVVLDEPTTPVKEEEVLPVRERSTVEIDHYVGVSDEGVAHSVEDGESFSEKVVTVTTTTEEAAKPEPLPVVVAAAVPLTTEEKFEEVTTVTEVPDVVPSFQTVSKAKFVEPVHLKEEFETYGNINKSHFISHRI